MQQHGQGTMCLFLTVSNLKSFSSGHKTWLVIQGVKFKVIETDLLANKSTTLCFDEFKPTRYSTMKYDHKPEVEPYVLNKNQTEQIKTFYLEVSAERLIFYFAYNRKYEMHLDNWWLWLSRYTTLLKIQFSQLYFDKHEWLELVVVVTELSIKGNKILDAMYPKQSLRSTAFLNGTGFAWFYGVISPVADGFILYHKPSKRRQHLDILVEIEKAKCNDCGTVFHALNFAQVCLAWKSELHFSTQTAAHSLSLPGNHFHYIRLVHTKQTKLSLYDSLFLYWPRELCPFNTDPQRRCSHTCKKHLYIEYHPRFNHTYNQTGQFYVHLLQHICDPVLKDHDSYLPFVNHWFDMNISRDSNGTWNEASELCKSEGGTLPIIRTKHEHDQIITFCKCSLTIMEIMFIGLFNNPANKVRTGCFCFWSHLCPLECNSIGVMAWTANGFVTLCSISLFGKMATLLHFNFGWTSTSEELFLQNTKKLSASQTKTISQIFWQ